MKNSLLQLENKYNTLVEEKNLNELKVDRTAEETDHLKLMSQVLEKQVEALSEALNNCEVSIEGLLRDKTKLSKLLGSRDRIVLLKRTCITNFCFTNLFVIFTKPSFTFL